MNKLNLAITTDGNGVATVHLNASFESKEEAVDFHADVAGLCRKASLLKPSISIAKALYQRNVCTHIIARRMDHAWHQVPGQDVDQPQGKKNLCQRPKWNICAYTEHTDERRVLNTHAI